MTQLLPDYRTAEEFTGAQRGHFPGFVGVVITSVDDELVTGWLEIEEKHLSANGFLHAAVVVTLADTLCGCGTLRSRPEGSSGFTTIELKSNFVGTAREGAVTCEARRMHAGRTTQVWDATVVAESTGKAIALFRCSQMILW